MNAELEQAAERLAEGRRTMVLATSGEGPWAAPVYYLFREGSFYFFSSPKSRHVTEALAGGRCAAAIFREGDDWREIEGLQMEGRVEEAGPDAAVFAAYLRRFPEAAVLGGKELGGFLEKLRTRLYRFVPERRLYLNNRLGFGKRVELQGGPAVNL
jgi:uncharacterized protein YhbP (UPF0306 family)